MGNAPDMGYMVESLKRTIENGSGHEEYTLYSKNYTEVGGQCCTTPWPGDK